MSTAEKHYQTYVAILQKLDLAQEELKMVKAIREKVARETKETRGSLAERLQAIRAAVQPFDQTIAEIEKAIVQYRARADEEWLHYERQSYEERKALVHNLSRFIQALYDYCYIMVPEYLPQPHEWVYASKIRPIQASWARIPEAHYLQLDHRENDWIYTLVSVPYQLDEKTMKSYELQPHREPLL